MRTVALLALVAVASASWNYINAEKWGENFPGCGRDAANQSPINLITGVGVAETYATAHGPLTLTFKGERQAAEGLSGNWSNTGYTLQLALDAGSRPLLGTSGERPVEGLRGMEAEAQKLNFHSPAEHLVNGKSYPLNLDIFHADSDGNVAVLSVFFEVNDDVEPNPALQQLFQSIPLPGVAPLRIENFDLSKVLPARGSQFYSYVGSTTTPPCVPGVRWQIYQDPLAISTPQMDRFNKFYRSNNRPLQPLNGRVVRLNGPTDTVYPDLTVEFEPAPVEEAAPTPAPDLMAA